MKIQSIKKVSLFIALFASQAFASSPLPDLAASNIDNGLPSASETSELVAALDALVNPNLANDVRVFAKLSDFANDVLRSTGTLNPEAPSEVGQQMRERHQDALQFLMRYLLVRVDTQNFVLETIQPEAIEPDLFHAYEAAEAAIIEFEAISNPTPEQVARFEGQSHRFWLAILAHLPKSATQSSIMQPSDYHALGQQLLEQVTPSNVYDRITELELMLEFQKPLYEFEQQVFKFQLEVIDSQKAYIQAHSKNPARIHSLETLAKIAQNNINKAVKNGVMLEKSGIQSRLEHLTQVLEKRFTKDKETFQQALAVYQAALQAVIEFRLSIQPVSSSF